MIQRLKKRRVLLGMVFMAAAGLFTFGMTWVVYLDQQVNMRMQMFAFDCGVDAIGTLVAVGLYYGCMRQHGEGTGAFRTLNVFVSASFVVNYQFYFTAGVPEWNGFTLTFALLSKLIDLVMIYYFYIYERDARF